MRMLWEQATDHIGLLDGYLHVTQEQVDSTRELRKRQLGADAVHKVGQGGDSQGAQRVNACPALACGVISGL